MEGCILVDNSIVNLHTAKLGVKRSNSRFLEEECTSVTEAAISYYRPNLVGKTGMLYKASSIDLCLM